MPSFLLVCTLPSPPCASLRHPTTVYLRSTWSTFLSRYLLSFQGWQAGRSLLHWFRAMLSWKHGQVHSSFLYEPHKTSSPHQMHVLFLGIARSLFVDCLPLEYKSRRRAHLLRICLAGRRYKVVSLSACVHMEMWPCVDLCHLCRQPCL